MRRPGRESGVPTGMTPLRWPAPCARRRHRRGRGGPVRRGLATHAGAGRRLFTPDEQVTAAGTARGRVAGRPVRGKGGRRQGARGAAPAWIGTTAGWSRRTRGRPVLQGHRNGRRSRGRGGRHCRASRCPMTRGSPRPSSSRWADGREYDAAVGDPRLPRARVVP